MSSGRPLPTTPVSTAAPRSPLLAVLLSGLGPGVGHVHAGRPMRGIAFTSALVLVFALWIRWIPVSWDLARLGCFLVALATLALLVDAGRVAHRAPRPFVPGAWNRGWVYAVGLLLTGFVGPLLLTAWIRATVAVARIGDDSMARAGLVASDWVVVERLPPGRPPARGEVVLVGEGSPSLAARVVALPGETVEIEDGLATIDGSAETDPLARALRSLSARRDVADGGLRMPPTLVGAGQLLLLTDARRRAEAGSCLVAAGAIRGRLRYVLVPEGLDVLRCGQEVQ